MLDLKAKLAAAGLVTKEDVDRVEKAKAGKKKRRGGRGRSGGKGKGKGKGHRLAVAELRGKNQGERYDAVRRLIERARLDDPSRPPTVEAQTFHFPTAKGQVGRLVLEPDVLGWVKDGGAAIVAYMSNHGLAHAPVPAAVARDIAELFPLWLRMLKGHAGAGRLEADEAATLSEGSEGSEGSGESSASDSASRTTAPSDGAPDSTSAPAPDSASAPAPDSASEPAPDSTSTPDGVNAEPAG